MKELKRQIEISSPCVIAEVKRIYHNILIFSQNLHNNVEDVKWTEAVEALPDTTKICSMNVMIMEIMIDVVKKARWNCWIEGTLLKEQK